MESVRCYSPCQYSHTARQISVANVVLIQWTISGLHRFQQSWLEADFPTGMRDESSLGKTAIITTLGLFKFLQMPFGLKIAAQCFRRNVHNLLKDLPFATFIYIEYLIVGSVNKEQHVLYLRCLFQRLKDKGILLNRKKCELGRASLTFLGNVVNAHGI